MTKSWSNERKVDRGLNRRSRSRDHSRDRHHTGAGSGGDVDSQRQHHHHTRYPSISPPPRSHYRDDVRKHNKGRELLHSSRTFAPSSPSSASVKRRKSRSPSVTLRNHPKKSRRRIPSSPPPRRRSPDRDHSPSRARGRHYSDRRATSPSSRRERRERTPPRYTVEPSQRGHSPNHRRTSFGRPSSRERRRDYSEERGRRSPHRDRYEYTARHRRSSVSRAPRDSTSPPPPKKKGKSRHNRDEYRPDSPVKSSRLTASGANSVELNMNHRSGYHPAFHHPNQEMQAAFPLNPQYNQPSHRYSQSPHHVTPVGSSYHGSPPAHSPYGAFQPSHHQQYSPHPQYNYPSQRQGSYGPPSGPSMHGNSPQYRSYHSSNYRGNQQGYQGQFGHGRGNFRGRGVSNYSAWPAGGPPTGPSHGQHSNSGGSTPQSNQLQPLNTRPQEPPVQNDSPPPQPPACEDGASDNPFRPSKELQVEDASSKSSVVNDKAMPPPERPPPPPERLPTEPQAQSKFSFAFKAAKQPPAAKPEITQKLTAAPSAGPPRREPFSASHDRERGPTHFSRATHASEKDRLVKSPLASRASNTHWDRSEPKEPAEPVTRKVKKIMKREKPRPSLPAEFVTSDSVYFRKPGNESVVGSGTYGKVFKGVHVYTKHMVALKKIRMEGERDGFPVTAVREIKLLQSLRHDNIVKLHEVMVERNDCFMVFEYLSHDLTGILNHPTFKLHDAHKKDLAKQMFEGLDYLHRKGVLHRDIKAANILVSSGGQLKIADFGLARFYAKRRQLEYTNRVITIWYRSPELLLGETQYGPAVDVWSAACVLVEIFTRHAIFPGDGTEMNQLDKIYSILGTPTTVEWPGLVDMAWFELLRPATKRTNVLAEKYRDRVSPAAFELLEAIFQYDPARRPSAADVLEHPYFTTEDPAPRKVDELKDLEGDWHEFESKALRKENERKDKEAKKAAQKESAAAGKKRALESEGEAGVANGGPADAKRVMTGLAA